MKWGKHSPGCMKSNPAAADNLQETPAVLATNKHRHGGVWYRHMTTLSALLKQALFTRVKPLQLQSLSLAAREVLQAIVWPVRPVCI